MSLVSNIRWRWRTRHCAHLRTIGVYGDMINAVGGRRLRCLACCRFLDGPVSAATAEPCRERNGQGVRCELCGPHQEHEAELDCGAVATWITPLRPV